MRSWRIVGAKARGSLHADRGEECQDAYAYLHLRGGFVAVVADGAGSAMMGGEGARSACNAVVEEVKRQWLDFQESEEELARLLKAAMFRARACLEESAAVYSKKARTDVKEALSLFSTTLLIFIKGQKLNGVLHVGDGWVIGFKREGFEILAVPDRGEYANETTFLTTSEPLEKVATINVKPNVGLRGIALITDGLEEVSMNLRQKSPFEPFWKGMFDFCKGWKSKTRIEAELEKFLKSERINNRTHDDKTLLLAFERTPYAVAVERPIGRFKRAKRSNTVRRGHAFRSPDIGSQII